MEPSRRSRRSTRAPHGPDVPHVPHVPRAPRRTCNPWSPAALALAALGALGALAAPTALNAQSPSSAEAQPPANVGEAFARAQQALSARDYRALQRALRAALAFAPDDAAALYHLARAEALTGDGAAAVATLERLAPQGAARDVAADSAFAALRALPHFQAVARRLAASAAPVVRSDTAFVLADPDFIPEGIAHDPGDDAFYVGSLHRRNILRVARDGAVSEFAKPGQDNLGQVLGLRVDGAARRLWVATLVIDSAAPRFARGTGGWAALHAYDLRTGRLVRRYAAPDSSRPHLLNDIALAPGGDLYVTDSEGNALYRLRAGADRLEPVHAGTRDFTYPNGVAVAADGTSLYVAHWEGMSTLAFAGAAAGRVTRVAAPPGLPTGNVDGLYACPGGLIAVQRLLDFQQVTWFDLGPGGGAIAGARALERRHPAHDAATTGAVARGALYYIANAQLGRLRDDGQLAPAREPRGTVVLRLPLDGACGAGPPRR